MLKYKGYAGDIQYSSEDDVLYGHVQGIQDTITYEGQTLDEVKEAFKDSVDNYLEFCQRKGKEPNKPYSGHIHVRTTPELHRVVALRAAKVNKSINTYVEEVLKQSV